MATAVNPSDVFRQEAAELLTTLETALLDLETAPNDKNLVDQAFRALHTLKGSGAMFGWEALADFTHHVESAFQKVRDGALAASHDLISLTLASLDHIYRPMMLTKWNALRQCLVVFGKTHEALAWIAFAVTLYAGVAMVTNLPFYSGKSFALGRSVPFWVILVFVAGFVFISSNPPVVLFGLFIIYGLSGWGVWVWRWRKAKRLFHRPSPPPGN